MASAAAQRDRLASLLDPAVRAAGYDLEQVSVSPAGRRRVVTVVVDSDGGISLDDIADVSRAVSGVLDEHDDLLGNAPYVLEVTSPGVDRPLTTEKHYRRARGRKVELTLSDGSQLTGRLGEIHGGTLRLVVREGARSNFSVRELPLAGIAKAVVQVEFSPPNQRELELAGQPGKEAST